MFISQTTDFHFANYIFSFRKLHILISQTTYSHFANYRFPFRKLQIFISFRPISFRSISFRKAGPNLIELIKHDIPLEQNNTELIKIQLNASECPSSSSAQSFKSEAVMRGFEHTFPDFKHFLPVKAFKIKTEQP